MKRSCAALLVVALLNTACAPTTRLLPMPEEKKVADFQPREPEVWGLPNGLQVLYMEDKELPTVRATLYLRGGTIQEPAEREGLLAAMGGMLRQGGAGELSPDVLDLELEKLSAAIGSGVSGEFGTVSLTSLSADLPRVFELFEKVILEPRFDERRLVILKGQLRHAIQQRKDEGPSIANTGFSQLLFREGAYGRVLESHEVDRISSSELRRSYREYMRPEGALLTITGDVSRDKVMELLNRRLANWRSSSRYPTTPPPVTRDQVRGIVFVKAPFAQATIVAGHLGVARHTQDQYAIQIFNEVFGAGGMASRLFGRVRTDLGLAYDASGAIMPGPVRGKNVITVQTKSATAGTALSEAIKVLEGMKQEAVPEDELNEKRSATLNSFVFANESTDATLQRRALFKIYGYPEEYDKTFMKHVASVKGEDVKRVAKERWNFDEFAVLVVGNEAALESLRSVRASLPQSLQGPIRLASFNEKLELKLK